MNKEKRTTRIQIFFLTFIELDNNCNPRPHHSYFRTSKCGNIFVLGSQNLCLKGLEVNSVGLLCF